MMCPPSPSGVRLLFFDMTWVPVGFPIGSVTSYDELWMSQSVSLEDPSIFPKRSLVLFLLGSIIRSLLRRTSRNLVLLVVALQHSGSIPR